MVRGILLILTLLVLSPILATAAACVNIVAPHRRAFHHAGRLWSRCALRVAGVRLEVEGSEILEQNRPAVAVSNHASNVDIYALCSFLPIPFMIPAKAALFRIPFLGGSMRAMGMVPLERSRSGRDVRELERMAAHFRERALLLFYPEGTRSPDGRLRRFKKGAFATAIRHQVPIVPILVAGTQRIQPRGTWRVRGGRVRVRVLDPVSTRGLRYEDRNELLERVWSLFANGLPQQQQPRRGALGPSEELQHE
jgi:1-acyl-sn-glycerol-3-phosphate acyltransferase